MNHEHPPFLQVYNDQLASIIPAEFKLHTPDQPFCFDPTCLCHQDKETREEFANYIYQYILDGLLTVQEAELLLAGKTI